MAGTYAFFAGLCEKGKYRVFRRRRDAFSALSNAKLVYSFRLSKKDVREVVSNLVKRVYCHHPEPCYVCMLKWTLWTKR